MSHNRSRKTSRKTNSSHDTEYQKNPCLMTVAEIHIYLKKDPKIRNSQLERYEQWIKDRYSKFLTIDENKKYPHLEALKELPIPEKGEEPPLPDYYKPIQTRGAYNGAEEVYKAGLELYRAGLFRKSNGLVYGSALSRQFGQNDTSGYDYMENFFQRRGLDLKKSLKFIHHTESNRKLLLREIGELDKKKNYSVHRDEREEMQSQLNQLNQDEKKHIQKLASTPRKAQGVSLKSRQANEKEEEKAPEKFVSYGRKGLKYDEPLYLPPEFNPLRITKGPHSGLGIFQSDASTRKRKLEDAGNNIQPPQKQRKLTI